MTERIAPLISIRETGSRIRWLISLRWLATGCLFAAITVANFLVGLPLKLTALYAGCVILLILNAGYSIFTRTLDFSKRDVRLMRNAKILINVQITLDLALLMYLIYFSGGTRNPFIVFFTFHMVCASILLSKRAAYFQATFASFLLLGTTLGEYFQLIPRHELFPLVSGELSVPAIRRSFGFIFALISALYITVYLSSTIVHKLREREREIDNAVGQLERSNIRLERKDYEKSKYVQTLTHDIKGALSSIQSCLRVVTEGFAGEISEKSNEMVSRAEKRSQNLLLLVNSLYFLSLLRATNEIDAIKMNLFDVLKFVTDKWLPVLQEKKILLQTRGDTSELDIMADEILLRKAFFELLDNAHRYSPPGKAIRVSVHADSRQYEARVTIIDSGIGMSAVDKDHVLEDFFRADIPKNAISSRPGLGLPLVKRIAELHGGSVEIDSELHKGSSITIKLPMINT